MNLKAVLNSLRTPYILFDRDRNIQAMDLTEYLNEFFHIDNNEFQQMIDDVIQVKKAQFNSITLNDGSKILVQCNPVFEQDEVLGILCIFQGALFSNDELDEYLNMSLDLKTIFESSYDVIYVTDGSGITLRVSSACEWIWGMKPDDLIGRSVYELEREGIFSPSVTRLVLEQKQKVTIIQKTKTGRNLLVVGTPVKDKNGQIVRVINASRAITEIEKLQRELQEMREIMDKYQKEISRLRSHENHKHTKLIYRSRAMEKVIDQVQKNCGVRYNGSYYR